MNSGFEDCTILSELMEELPENAGDDEWGKMMRNFSELRKLHADAILDLALHNYIVMRDKTGDPKYQLQKRLSKNCV